MQTILSKKAQYPVIDYDVNQKMLDSFEDKYDGYIDYIANTAVDANKRIILLTGPSASGKTTTAHKIAMKISSILSNGVSNNIYEHCKIISLDNFFKSACDAPMLENGEQDYESIDAVDVEKIEFCLKQLLKDGKAKIPSFDFLTATQHPDSSTIDIGNNGFVILEGIHALNPLIYSHLPQESILKLYISAHSSFASGDSVVMDRRQVRFVRRAIRDYKFRGSSLENTCKMWVNVILAEDKYIAPYRKNADIVIDTTNPYEMNIFKPYVKQLFATIDKSSSYYEQCKNILASVELFCETKDIILNKTSIICEFIGGGKFIL